MWCWRAKTLTSFGGQFLILLIFWMGPFQTTINWFRTKPTSSLQVSVYSFKFDLDPSAYARFSSRATFSLSKSMPSLENDLFSPQGLCSPSDPVKVSKFPVTEVFSYTTTIEVGDLIYIYGTTNLTFPSQDSKFSIVCGSQNLLEVCMLTLP